MNVSIKYDGKELVFPSVARASVYFAEKVSHDEFKVSGLKLTFYKSKKAVKTFEFEKTAKSTGIKK